MMKQALAQFPLPMLTIAALLLFFAVFVGVLVRTCIFTSRADADARAGLAIDNSEQDLGGLHE